MSSDPKTIQDIIDSVARTHRISLNDMMRVPPEVLRDLISFETLIKKRESWAKTQQQLRRRADNLSIMLNRLDDAIWRHPDNLLAVAFKAGSLPAVRPTSRYQTEDEEREQDFDDSAPSSLQNTNTQKTVRIIQAREVYF